MTTPVLSFVCCWNDHRKLRTCLQASLESVDAGRAGLAELVLVDNRDRAYTTAGAALNHGAQQARGRWLVFAHQDVIVHDVAVLAARLEEAARLSERPMVGAAGVDRRGRLVGHIRDRVVWVGKPASQPQPVDSVDELLFAVERDIWRRYPLAESTALAWHGYAVEYGLRLRESGIPTVAIDLCLTHNSTTSNLEGLEAAHRHLAAEFRHRLPVETTCGRVAPEHGRNAFARARARRAGVATRMRTSLLSRLSGCPVRGDDIRIALDEVVAVAYSQSERPIQVIDLGDRCPDACGSGSVIEREGGSLEMVAAGKGSVRDRLRSSDGSACLVVGASAIDLVLLIRRRRPEVRVAGYHPLTGGWALLGAGSVAAGGYPGRGTSGRRRHGRL
jgi:Glycosyltransferase like family